MALFVLSLCPFDISAGVGAFVIGLSQISSFSSIYIQTLSPLYGHVNKKENEKIYYEFDFVTAFANTIIFLLSMCY